jgi:hypothetical protein
MISTAVLKLFGNSSSGDIGPVIMVNRLATPAFLIVKDNLIQFTCQNFLKSFLIYETGC